MRYNSQWDIQHIPVISGPSTFEFLVLKYRVFYKWFFLFFSIAYLNAYDVGCIWKDSMICKLVEQCRIGCGRLPQSWCWLYMKETNDADVYQAAKKSRFEASPLFLDRSWECRENGMVVCATSKIGKTLSGCSSMKNFDFDFSYLFIPACVSSLAVL